MNKLIILGAILLIMLLAGIAIYILANESFMRLFQKLRFESTFKKRSTNEDKGRSLERFVTQLVEQFNLEDFFKVEKIKDTLSNTGKSTNMTLDSVLLAKVGFPIIVFILSINLNFAGFIFDESNPDFKIISFLISILLGAACFPLPDYLIHLDAQKRAADFMMTFPAVLDLLLICIQAGISFEHSLQRVTRDASILSPVTGEELTRILKDIHILGSREQALLNFKRRIPTPAVEDFVLVVLQSERYGTSISEAFRVLSETVRAQQMMILERKVLKLPAKISGVVMVFMMPTVMMMIFAPLLLGGIGAE